MINSKRIYKGFRDLKVYDEVARMLSSMMENPDKFCHWYTYTILRTHYCKWWLL